CDPNPRISYTDRVSSSDCAGNLSIARAWTATDECGNSVSCTQQVTVVCPLAIITNCVTPGPNGVPGAYVTLPVGSGSTCIPTNGSFFAHGTTNTVTCTNTAGTTCIFTVFVLDDCAVSCDATTINFSGCPNSDGGTYQCLNQVPSATNFVVTAVDDCGN